MSHTSRLFTPRALLPLRPSPFLFSLSVLTPARSLGMAPVSFFASSSSRFPMRRTALSTPKPSAAKKPTPVSFLRSDLFSPYLTLTHIDQTLLLHSTCASHSSLQHEAVRAYVAIYNDLVTLFFSIISAIKSPHLENLEEIKKYCQRRMPKELQFLFTSSASDFWLEDAELGKQHHLLTDVCMRFDSPHDAVSIDEWRNSFTRAGITHPHITTSSETLSPPACRPSSALPAYDVHLHAVLMKHASDATEKLVHSKKTPFSDNALHSAAVRAFGELITPRTKPTRAR